MADSNFHFSDDDIPDDSELYDISEDYMELSETGDHFLDEDYIVEDTSGLEFQEESETLEIESSDTLRSDTIKDKNLKEKLYYNRLNKLEFLGLFTNVVTLIKNGAYFNIPKHLEFNNLNYIDSYENFTEETLALIVIMTLNTNMFSVKRGKVYNVSNYPIEDYIHIFKHYLPYFMDHPNIYRIETLKKYFPNIFENMFSKKITENEIKDCIK